MFGVCLQLPGRLFIIGKPSSYHLDGILPRLPSYESVRKKDRQRHIHSMIADRFGISPTQSETEVSHSWVLDLFLYVLFTAYVNIYFVNDLFKPYFTM